MFILMRANGSFAAEKTGKIGTPAAKLATSPKLHSP